jgi:dnd system-associated protein 4
MIDQTSFINIDEFHYENTYKRLAPSKGGKSAKDVVFKEMWEIFVWSAILGYRNKERKQIDKRASSPPFRWQVIKEPHQKLLLVMAVESVQNFEILKNPEELKKNIEEHSNAGLSIMHKEMALDKLAYQNIESLIYLIQSRIS